MRRNSTSDHEDAAQRRLEQLGRDLAVPPPVLVGDPGRHARRVGGRYALRLVHLGLLAVVLAIAVAAVAWTTLHSAPTTLPVAHTTRSPEVGPTPSGVPTTAPSSVTVDVSGKVRHPGITSLPVGSRVVDALREAGGARHGVDLGGLNLARVLVDGEQISVGAAASGPSGPAAPGESVSLNSAGLEQLDALPGVGPVTAQKILDWRTAHGAFSSVDELLEVDGIGAKTLARLGPHLTL